MRRVVLWGVGAARVGLAARIFVPSALNLMRPAGLQLLTASRKRSIDFAEAPPHKTSNSRLAQGGADCLSINTVPRLRGRVSRAAKGADCKSAGYAFVGSSPTSPTIQFYALAFARFFQGKH